MIKEILIKDLKQHSNTPELHISDDPDEQRLLSKAFVLKITELTHKYHMILNQIINKQHEDRRLAAIEQKNDIDFSKAFYEKDLRKMKIATEIEDIIFDYFGIIEMQFEAANNFFKNDPGFKEAKENLKAKISEEVARNYGDDESEQYKALTVSKAQEHMKKIHLFTN